MLNFTGRVIVTGGPKTGKTTLVGDSPAVHGDDYAHLGWSECSAAIAGVLVAQPEWVAEGVQLPRALKKVLEVWPNRKPCDRVYVLSHPHQPLTADHTRMTTSLHNLLDSLTPRLLRLGVEIEWL